MTGYVGCGSGIAGWVLASLDFFASVFYQEKIEGPAGEAKDRLKQKSSKFSIKINYIVKLTL